MKCKVCNKEIKKLIEIEEEKCLKLCYKCFYKVVGEALAGLCDYEPVKS